MKSRSRALAICLVFACLGAALTAAAANAAAPAWEPIAASGPTNLPPVQSEIQRLAVDAEDGTYTLTYPNTATGTGTLNGASVTGSVTAGSNEVKPQSGFFTLVVSGGTLEVGEEIVGPGIPDNTTITVVSKNFAGFVSKLTLSASATETINPVTLRAGSKTVTSVTTATGAFAVGDSLSASGIPAGTTITACAPECGPSATSLTLSTVPSESGAKALTANQTTAPIAFDAEASEVEAALDALGALDVSVTGGPGGPKAQTPYNVAFDGGTLSNTDVTQLVADSSELLGGDNGVAQVFTALQGGPGTTRISVYPQNVGGLPSDGSTTTLEVDLPASVVTESTPTGNGWSCVTSGAGQEVTCTSTRVAGPGLTLPPVNVPVRSAPGAEDGVVDVVEVEVSGGGAAQPASYAMPLTISKIPAPPGLQSFTAAPYTDTGAVDSRAGAHPYSASTGILVNTVRSATGVPVPAGEFRDIVVDTPPGFFGNPTATPSCPEATEQEDCPHNTIVATAQVPVGFYGSGGERSAVNSIEAPFGYPAKFRFITGNRQIIVNVAAALRSDEDYGLEIGSYNTPQIQPVYGAFFTIWGTPADPAHDGQRCAGFNMETDCKTAAEVFEDEVAFLTNPVDCAEEAARPPVATINVNTWQNPGLLFSRDVALKPVEGCEELDFEVDKFAFQPGGSSADSPASFTTEFELPSEGLLDPDKRMNPTIRETVLDLPEGVVLNASAADGLAACSRQQIGFKGTGFPRPNEIRFDRKPNKCPDASKIGSGELKSSLLAETLSADLFLAEQGDGNPFGSLFAIYLVVESEERGLNIKLPAEVQVNAQSGKQKVVFKDLPPLPFDSLKLRLKGGARSPLAMPTTCGTYTTTATNTPWSAPESGPPLVSPSSFQVNSGPNGTACANTPAERPFALGLRAGSTNPVAGAHSPFQIQLTRGDGNQELNRLDIAMPPGFVASLRGVPYCSEAQIAAAIHGQGRAEQAGPSCPAASRVGSTNSAAGSGPSPFYAPGALYLSGPYKGAPLSVVAITPAVAGPFDLGNVVVRSALRIDPVTARITAHTDPLPRILKGVPLRIRDVRVNLDRPNWAQNPTSCEEKQVNVTAHGANGAVSQPANRFQVGNCPALGFKPRTNIRLFGKTNRGAYQGVRAIVRPRAGDANISRSVVRFPTSAFVAQEHIRTVCTRVQFAADACPKGSIYGRAIAHTPLLDEPLRGNVYLRSSNNTLPDAVADLRGPAHQPIRVEVAIRNDSVKGALRNTVLSAPDAPVSYFRLQMFGGKKGLIVNSRNICKGKNAARVTMAAHNGRRDVRRVNVFNKRCKQQRKAERRKAAKRKRAAHSRRG